MRAPLVDHDVAVTGSLNDKAWSGAAEISDLKQAAPVPAAATPYKTRVLVLLDPHALVIGAECFDPNPSAIKAPTLTRDGMMTGNDTFTVVLDTFGDKQTGYLFRVNASGTMQDGLIASATGDPSYSWDGDWEARIARTDKGWSCELRIPYSTLRFKQGADAWGFNVERVVARDSTRLRWAGISLDAAINDMSRAGTLSGFLRLSRPPRLALAPYVLAQANQDVANRHSSIGGKEGIDASYALTTDLSAVLTLNTDFAETEVDEQQINLNRFPLFFPEKRRFFLEGSNQFTFGLNIDRYFLPFYSRNIGLFDGEQVPLDAGLKLIGKLGRLSVGTLVTRMGEAPGAEPTTLAAGRLAYDLNDDLKVGTIFTDGSPDGTARNTLFGFDALWHTSKLQGNKNGAVGAWYAKAAGSLGSGSRDGWGLDISYPNDLWDIEAGHDEFGDALLPALGFIERPGEERDYLALDYQPRSKSGPFQQWFFQIEPTEWRELGGRVITRRWFLAPFNVVTPQGDHLEIDVIPDYEFVTNPFALSQSVTIPTGGFGFTRYLLQLEAGSSRPISPTEDLEWGPYFGGHLMQWTQGLSWTANKRLRLRLSSEDDYGDFPGGKFHDQFLETRLDLAFTPLQTLSGLAQYDSQSQSFGFDLRYRQTFAPGDDLFVVWNRNWSGSSSNLRRFGPVFNGVAVKLAWTFRS